jgi:transposase-like protein
MKKHYTLSEKASFVEDFKKSGFTQSEFSRQHELSQKTLSRWLRVVKLDELKQEEALARILKPQSLFMPVLVKKDVDEDEEVIDTPLRKEKLCETPRLAFVTLKAKGFSLDIPTNIDVASPLLGQMIQLLHAL